MKIYLKFFAQAKELVQTDELELELTEAATLADLKQALRKTCPQLKTLFPHLLFALETDYITDETSLPPDGTIACFPPVSGG